MFAAIAIIACAGCRGESQPAARSGAAPSDPVAVRVASVNIRSVQRGVEVTGTLFGDDEAAIAARVKGPIVAVFKDMGDRAEPGEPLAQVDRTDYELARMQGEAALREALARLGLDELPEGEFDVSTLPAVQRAKAEEANARARHARGQTLYDDDPPLISEQDLENLATALEVASREVTAQMLAGRALLSIARTRRADLAVAEQQLRDTEIRAPATVGEGTHYAVVRRAVSVGEFVDQGDAVFTLVDDDPVKYRVEAPERYLGVVLPGQLVRVEVEAYNGSFEGRVTRLSPSVNPESRTFEVEAEIPNDDRRLKPGAFARGRIETDIDANVPFVPLAAVATFAGVKRVYSVRDGKAQEHRISTGAVIDGEVEVIGGDLPADALVVIEGAARLSPGAPVEVRDAIARADEPADVAVRR